MLTYQRIKVLFFILWTQLIKKKTNIWTLKSNDKEENKRKKRTIVLSMKQWALVLKICNEGIKNPIYVWFPSQNSQ